MNDENDRADRDVENPLWWERSQLVGWAAAAGYTLTDHGPFVSLRNPYNGVGRDLPRNPISCGYDVTGLPGTDTTTALYMDAVELQDTLQDEDWVVTVDVRDQLAAVWDHAGALRYKLHPMPGTNVYDVTAVITGSTL